MPTTKPEIDPRSVNQVLDKALADTFPASDPPAATGVTPAASPSSAKESAHAFLILSQSMADKPLPEWRTSGQKRWVSPNLPCVQLAMTPALAMLDALTSHGFDRNHEWVLVHVKYPVEQLRRLDTPHECWRERTFRNDVRLFGDRWVADQASVALRVPSPLCPEEFNLIVNLLHPELACIEVAAAQPIEIDSRLQLS